MAVDFKKRSHILAVHGVQLGEDGRHWYGPSCASVEPNLDIKFCGATDSTFASEDLKLTLKSRGGDIQTVVVDGSGAVSDLEPDESLRPGASCGSIFASGTEVGTEDLKEGTKPVVVFLCENPRVFDRYPKTDAYAFQKVTRTEVKGEREAPRVCLAE